tara:strand:+ start:1052 stop:1531 length:480 start_codon:yes stop_codon:yes gene_type:complete
MKKLFFTFLIASSFLAARADIRPSANEADFVISKMWESFVQGDHKMFAETMAQDTDMVTFGTDASERWDGWDDLQKSVKNQFDAFDILHVKRMNKKLNLSNSGEVAWFSEIVDWEFLVEGKKQIIEGVRYTGVMEKRENEWKIVQFHSSVGVSGQVIAY